MSQKNRNSEAETLNAPPRFLLWLVIVIFFLLIVGVLAGFSYFSGGERLLSLVPFAGIALAGLILAVIGGAVVFRRSLPRLMWLWVTILAVILVAGLGVGGLYAYQNILPPRYQEQMITEVPFMRAFMRATPEGGIIPTVPPHTGGISPDDLLNLTVDTETAIPPTDISMVEGTQEATTAPIVAPPTATPLQSPTPTTEPPTAITRTTAVPTPEPPTTIAPTAAPQDPSTAQSVAAINRPAAQRMYGFTYVRETWNNCGPANITMVLSHYGWRQTQEFAASYLKPNPEDKNVSPAEMVNFVRTQTQISAITRIGGDMEMLKDLIAANIPVIIETGYSLEGESWLGHYQTIVGYDDTQSVFYIYDSWLGTGTGDAGMTEHYSDFDSRWQAFNRTFIVVYEKDREGTVQQILGDRADVTKADQHALDVAVAEAKASPQNGFAWFNIGTAYDKLGQYDKAAAAYDRAFKLQVLPFRMLWYQFGPFDAYFQTGRYDDVLALATNNISSAGQYVEETFYWQGKVYQAQGKMADASAAFQKALAQNPNMQAARDALATITS